MNEEEMREEEKVFWGGILILTTVLAFALPFVIQKTVEILSK